MEQTYFISICICIGACAGFLGGLLGIGGGVIVVPALVLLFDLIGLFPYPDYPKNTLILVAVATSMASIIATTGSSAYAQYRRDAIDWHIVRGWIVYLIGGAFAASFIAKLLPAYGIKLFIGTFIFFVSISLLYNRIPRSTRQLPGSLGTAGVATAGGLIAGMAGIGGGNVVVPTLLYFNVAAVRAAAAASTVGIGISIFGTLGYIVSGLDTDIPGTLGYVYLPALVPIAIACVVAAPFGVKLLHKINANTVRRMFGVLTLLVSIRMFYTAFN